MRHDTWNPRCGLWLLVVAIQLVGVWGTARAEPVLNEFLANPGRDWDGDGVVDTRLDEWVEVFNPGPSTIDLADYWYRDGLNQEPNLQLFGSLAPGETAVFYGSDAVAWQQANGLPSVGLSLNNGGDTAVLMKADPDDPDSYLTVDSFTYTAHVGVVDRSCGRLPDGGQWVLFDGLNPYGGGLFPQGTGCEPSPGQNNVCNDDTSASRANWSELKNLWR